MVIFSQSPRISATLRESVLHNDVRSAVSELTRDNWNPGSKPIYSPIRLTVQCDFKTAKQQSRLHYAPHRTGAHAGLYGTN